LEVGRRLGRHKLNPPVFYELARRTPTLFSIGLYSEHGEPGNYLSTAFNGSRRGAACEWRVSLDSVIFAFNEGSTPEEIAQQYPTLNLADIYAVISYYLQNHDEVVEYLQRRKAHRAELKEEVESRFDPQGIRDRLLARKRSRVTE
jgi:hypothetical protein